MVEWPDDDDRQQDEIPDEDALAIQEQIEREAELSLRRAEARQRREAELGQRRENVRRQRMEPGPEREHLLEPAALADPEPPQGPQQKDETRLFEEMQQTLDEIREILLRSETHLEKIAENIPSAGVFGP